MKFQTGIGSYRMCGKLANLAQTLNYGRSRMKSVLDSRKFGKDFVFFVFDTLKSQRVVRQSWHTVTISCPLLVLMFLHPVQLDSQQVFEPR